MAAQGDQEKGVSVGTKRARKSNSDALKERKEARKKAIGALNNDPFSTTVLLDSENHQIEDDMSPAPPTLAPPLVPSSQPVPELGTLPFPPQPQLPLFQSFHDEHVSICCVVLVIG